MAEQLTDRLATDLDDGFTELVRIYGGAVCAYLFRVTGSAATADDLAQDTFLRAYTALQEYSPARRRELRPRAWLMTIAANVWRNHVRACTRRPVSAVQIEDAFPVCTEEGPGPEEHAVTVDDRRRLVAALGRLPERHRSAVVLRFIIGMTNAEVAEVQACPVGTVKAQVSRGLSSLRELLLAETGTSKEVAV
ncbi:RNA polymerase sigma factor [Kitasatospora phosalacinea]|uniref:RNA polymerase sigma factor n=1 Tax=Kitasatospora phosalacinea TaxID=2065 RepID=UPI003651F545